MPYCQIFGFCSVEVDPAIFAVRGFVHVRDQLHTLSSTTLPQRMAYDKTKPLDCEAATDLR